MNAAVAQRSAGPRRSTVSSNVVTSSTGRSTTRPRDHRLPGRADGAGLRQRQHRGPREPARQHLHDLGLRATSSSRPHPRRRPPVRSTSSTSRWASSSGPSWAWSSRSSATARTSGSPAGRISRRRSTHRSSRPSLGRRVEEARSCVARHRAAASQSRRRGLPHASEWRHGDGAPRDLKVFAILSPVQGEGKTTTAANLAVTLSHADSRVLLIAADLRRPSLYRFFQLDNQIGLSDVLLGEVAARRGDPGGLAEPLGARERQASRTSRGAPPVASDGGIAQPSARALRLHHLRLSRRCSGSPTPWRSPRSPMRFSSSPGPRRPSAAPSCMRSTSWVRWAPRSWRRVERRSLSKRRSSTATGTATASERMRLPTTTTCPRCRVLDRVRGRTEPRPTATAVSKPERPVPLARKFSATVPSSPHGHRGRARRNS